MYGDAQTKSLPIGGFEWVSNTDKLFSDKEAVLKIPDNSETGYIFEVDLHYPENIHNLHNDFPFCAEKRTLPEEAIKILGVKKNKIDKLLLTLYDKEKYVVDYRMLKLALQHGLELKNIRRILKFKQWCWLKPYIDLNIELRKNAQNEFEKAFFKLLINAIFGKTMENLRLRHIIRLVCKWGGRVEAKMLIARPSFKKCTIFDENLVAIELEKTSIFMNKPIAIGMCILDISKITMYRFLYDFLKPKYDEKCCVAYTDTDSFILQIKTSDFYDDIRKNISMFDTSDYPYPNDYNIKQVNKKVPGLFKDEANGKVLVEFVGLRAKCYAVRALDAKSNNIIKRAKGVKKCVVNRNIQFEDYINCIEQNCELKREQNTIRSIKHNVYSICQNKVALNPSDDKRYIIKQSQRVDTLAWGHYEIDAYEENYQLSIMNQ